MKLPAIVIFDSEYFLYKKDFINEKYEVINYASLTDSNVGRVIASGKTALSLKSLINMDLRDIKIILAFPLFTSTKKVINMLFKLGIDKEDIVLLLGAPNPFLNERVSFLRKDIEWDMSSNGEVICKVDGKQIFVESNNELYIILEIFGRKCYDFFMSYDNITVVDIGMNIGIASIFFSGFANIKNIYSYEPFLPTYNRALENFELNNVRDKITANSFGIGSENKQLDLSYNEDAKGFMSTVSDNAPYANSESGKVSVGIRDIAEIFGEIIKNHPSDTFVFKIDCEGGEYDILERLSETGLLKRIKLLLMEWHNLPDKTLPVLENIFRQNNFCYRVDGQHNPKTGMLYAWAL